MPKARGKNTDERAALIDARDRLLEAALWLSAGEPRERVAEPLLHALEVLETLVTPDER